MIDATAILVTSVLVLLIAVRAAILDARERSSDSERDRHAKAAHDED